MIEITSLCGQISLGKQGENLARMVCFDEPAMWEETFGEGRCELVHQRNGDEAPYPVVLNVENGKVYWKITNADTANVGEGKCELHYIVNDIIIKSKTWTTTVSPSLGDAIDEAPEPQKAWVDQVLTAADEVKSATTHQPIIGENKNWFVWDVETQKYVDTGVMSEGKKGEDGSITFIVVDELPTENINESAIYMKPSINPSESNTFDEYIYTNGSWECIGSANVSVDLTDYVKNTDYANQSVAGVVKGSTKYGVLVGNGGFMSIQKATEDEINSKNQDHKPIVPSNLEYAVKSITYDKAEIDVKLDGVVNTVLANFTDVSGVGQ